MKPKGWSKLTQDEKDRIGKELFESLRGISVIHQALEVAVKSMRQEPHPALSNIEDMEILLKTVFRIG